MEIKGILIEDYINYKKPSMLIKFPKCNFKCDKECGKLVCQNSALAKSPNIQIAAETLVDMYIKNSFTSAIVCGGLEPMDSYKDLHLFIKEIRKKTLDDIVIYTGYTEEELKNQLAYLRPYKKIIFKFGRYIPNQEPHFDEVLGVNLASDNQYGKVIS